MGLSRPDSSSVRGICGQFGVPLRFMASPLSGSRDTHIRISSSASSALVILHIPYGRLSSSGTIPCAAIPFNVVVAPGIVVAIYTGRATLVSRYQSTHEIYPPFSHRHFIFGVLLEATSLCLDCLHRVHSRTSLVRDGLRLRETLGGSSVVSLESLRGTLICFAASLATGRVVMDQLNRVHRLKVSRRSLSFLRSMTVRCHRTLRVSGVRSGVLANAVSTFTSIVSGGLGHIVGSLASIAVIFVLPALVTSVFNVGISLPFGARGPLTFVVVLTITITVSLLAITCLVGQGVF